MDLDGSPLHALGISLNMHQKQFSEEFQLNGAMFDDRLDYVLGAYYFTEEGDLHDLATFREGMLQVDGPNQLKTTAWAWAEAWRLRSIEALNADCCIGS